MPHRSAPIRRAAMAALALALSACTGTATQPGWPGDTVAIGQVQGNAARSPLEGRTVTVEGVVTGAFSAGLGGWFVQDAGDGDARTADGLFVLDGADVDDLRAGARVRIHGEVVEHGDHGGPTLTALAPRAVELLGEAPLPPALRLRAPPPDWSRYEGMRVHIEVPLTVSGHHDLERQGVLQAAFDGRLYTPTEVVAPGEAARAMAADNARRGLLLDDASAERPASVWYLPAQAQAPRSGSRIHAGAEGIVDMRWGEPRLQLTAPLQLDPAPRPQPPRVAGDLRLAALNLENLFNGDGDGGGFPTPRGARTRAEFEVQLARHVATIHALDADIVALMELENDDDGAHSAVAALVSALDAGGGAWHFVANAAIAGGDAVRVGLLYRDDRVRTHGGPAALTDGPFAYGSRPPLAQAFVPATGGPPLVVVANHFKSKGCGNASGADADQGDGQSCWNATRVAAARALHDWLATDPTGAGSALTAIVGDLNAYAQEDPLRVLHEAGWQDAFAVAGVERPYSYVYNGQAGRLDHALLSPALAARLAGAAHWHANADEPAALGYRHDPARTPWRSSDHDPLLLGFHLSRPH
ncbi:ExeM/NucH family extracellular endonuclease [Luteimonas sp. MHLX1A]|uniref:ExeM/NucH family extracellular endonuclease n=1 Tax=Alterluteimonas muca TaxID=2878684 RepID=UPI001E2D265F|nr:ExeM/NucH family extracellular endonuclease [Luteimonas sp. MHLX1A]MCD9047942.1 ExeM/NucH family extracellular endonuclease [Luteimonas sp. MHLX1A]